MAQSRFEGDAYFAGNLGAKTFSPPAGSITNAAVAALAGIDSTKLEHQHRVGWSQANVTAAAETRVVYVCYGTAGTILDFRAGSIAKAVGDPTVTVNLRKNGTTVLSSVITLDSGNTNRVAEAGTLSVTTLAAGDVLEVVVAVSAGTGTLPTGLFASVTVEEDAQ